MPLRAEGYSNIHASCVALGDAGAWIGAPADTGVLILGPSGSGKSDLTLRLLQFGACLVSDDRTDLHVENGALMAQAPQTLRGLIEVRGLGIVRLDSIPSAKIVLAVQLETSMPIPRFPEPEWFSPPGLRLPEACRPRLIRLDPREASAPAKVAAAIALLRQADCLHPALPYPASMSAPDR